MKLRRALVSVHDKTGLAEFAHALVERGIEIVAADGTEQFLRDEGVPVTSVDAHIGAPAMATGSIAGVHPQLQQALLWGREKTDGNGNGAIATDDDGGIGERGFDIVVMNFTPFERVAMRRSSREDDIIEAIDITGPGLLRAAAKNFERVVVLADPEVYPLVLEELNEREGELPYDVRKLLASRAFDTCAHYELAIANWFSGAEDFPTYMLRDYVKMSDLPYGENPHQRAAYYVEVGARRHLLSMVEQMQGGELTFNNLNDLNTARGVIGDFTIPGCVIIKHAAPCGVAVSGDIAGAFERALSADEPSAYGGVIAVNRTVDEATAENITKRFFEVIFAPNYTDEALEVLKKRPEMRVLADRERRKKSPGERDMRRVIGGMLVQDTDGDLEEREYMSVVTEAHPTEKQWGDLLFAWRVAKWVPSNAAVFAKELTTVGIGGHLPSRIDSIDHALKKAGDRVEGSMMAADAFIAFEDAAAHAIDAGIAGLIQPGGADNDDAIIALADKAGIPMVFTGRRHFRH